MKTDGISTQCWRTNCFGSRLSPGFPYREYVSVIVKLLSPGAIVQSLRVYRFDLREARMAS